MYVRVAVPVCVGVFGAVTDGLAVIVREGVLEALAVLEGVIVLESVSAAVWEAVVVVVEV
jgi:hypothetical protein